MRNLTTTSVVIEHPDNKRRVVERWATRLEVPSLYQKQDTAILLGTKQRPIRIRKYRRCSAEEREQINAELLRHINEDREETGDGILLIEENILHLVHDQLRDRVFSPRRAASTLQSVPIVRCLIGAGELR